MKCEKCGSENVTVVTMEVTKKKKHGLLYWLCFIWLFDFLFWCLLFIVRLIIQIFKKKTKQVVVTIATCQNCGYHWEIKDAGNIPAS